MKAAVKSIIKDERGKALVVALILLVVGGLIMTPLLGLMTTGLASGQVYEKKTAELYAADSGVEYAIWHLEQAGDPDEVLEFTLNGKNVTVQIVKLDTPCGEPCAYNITSTATSADGSSTTVLAQVTNVTVYIEGGYLGKNATIGANVFAPGDLFMDSGAEIQGNVIVGGDLVLNECALVGGIACVGGDLTLNEGAEIEMDLYCAGNILMQGGSTGSWVDGDVYAQGDVTMEGQSEIFQTLWSGSNKSKGVTIDSKASVLVDVHVRFLAVIDLSGQILGDKYEDYYDHYCPLGETQAEIEHWLII
jgi:Tfp pilus assembly protein PilX